MSHLDGKCDNPKCSADIKAGEGDFWITGAYLCPKCKKEWSDNYDRIITTALKSGELENYENYEEKPTEFNVSNKELATKDREKKLEKKWFG